MEFSVNDWVHFEFFKFIQLNFIEDILCARHCFYHWGFHVKKTNFFLQGAHTCSKYCPLYLLYQFAPFLSFISSILINNENKRKKWTLVLFILHFKLREIDIFTNIYRASDFLFPWNWWIRYLFFPIMLLIFISLVRNQSSIIK